MSYIPTVTGIIDTNNSTTSTLLANATFTGTSSQVVLYSQITVNVSSNVSSALNGLSLQFSSDGVNWDSQVNYTFAPNNTVRTTPVLAKFFRIVYTNGTTNQTSFRLQTLLHPSKNLIGQSTMSNSSSVVIASDQSSVPVYMDSKFSNEIGFKTDYLDPFSKLLTCQTTQLGSHDFKTGKASQYWDEIIVGNATSTHNANKVCIDMTCTTNSTDSVIRQTFRQFEYIKGNSQTVYMSCNIGGDPVSGNTRRIGYFDSNNGAFFEIDSTNFKVVRRTSTSGSVVDNAVTQANFNVDKLDGSGPSGITIDLSKQQLFYIEFSWLGTNTLEFGVFINTKKILAHIINNANVISSAWCQSGQLPLRVENFNIGTASRAVTLEQGCSAVFSNGSVTQYQQIRSIASTIANPITITSTETVIAGIRLEPNLRNNGCQAISYQFLPYSVSNNNAVFFFSYRVILRPTLVGATWSNVTDSIEALTNTPSSYSGGIVLDQGFVSTITTGRININLPSLTDAILGYSINNIPDSLIIVASTNAGTATIQFAGFFRDL